MEDIIDSGHTLARLSAVLKDAGADTVKVVALLDKKGRRRVEFFPDYCGWEVGHQGCAERHDAWACAASICKRPWAGLVRRSHLRTRLVMM